MPCIPILQAKGSAGAILLDLELEGFNCLNDAADRAAWNIPFNSCDLKLTRALNQSATIRGDRNPSPPFQGKKEVAGNLVTPVNFYHSGLFFLLCIGIPTTTEFPPADIASGGTADIDGSGTVTFGSAQAGIGLGDRVRFTYSNGTVVDGFVTTRTSDTSMVVKAARDAGSDLSSLPQTGARVTYAANNIGTSLPNGLTISGGVCTFETVQTGVASGQMIIYDTNKRAYVTGVTSSTVVTVVDGYGLPAPDAAAVDMEALEAAPIYLHLFVVDPTASLTSATIARGFQDLDPEIWQYYTGCKVNQWGIEIGGDGELLHTMAILAADEIGSNDPYDSGDSPDRINKPIDRFEQFDATANEFGNQVNYLKSISFQVANNLDADSFTIGGGGVRAALPEGIAGVSGKISALFIDDDVLGRAQGNTTSSIEVTFTQGIHSLTIIAPEVKFQNNSPAISGPGGVSLDLDFQGFFSTNPVDSAVVVQLVNHQASYVPVY